MERDGGHDLVIGGSGMLAGLCVRLAAEGRTVSVVGRDGQRLRHLAEQAAGPGSIVPVPADYADRSGFCAALASAVAARGRFQRAVCWIHEVEAPDGPLDTAGSVTGTFWHVMSSAADDPAHPRLLVQVRDRFRAAYPALDYRQIVLGFVVKAGDCARWHTNEEISADVAHAMRSGEKLARIGTTRPWQLRP